MTELEINQVVRNLYSKRFDLSLSLIKEEMGKYLDSSVLEKIPQGTRGIDFFNLPDDEKVSPAMRKVIEEILGFSPESYDTQEEYFLSLENVLQKRKFNLSKDEYDILSIGVNTSRHVLGIYLEGKSKIGTRGWWSDWGKCATAIIGGAVTSAAVLGIAGAELGAKIGAAGGTAAGGVGAGPGLVGGAAIGAALGAVAGAIGGGLSAAAAAC